MRTPSGKLCKYYYADFHRGRNVQECRSVKQNADSLRWQPSDCHKCPVPEILNANASSALELKVTISSRLLGILRNIEVVASCNKHQCIVPNPYIGCEPCNHQRKDVMNLFDAALQDAESDEH